MPNNRSRWTGLWVADDGRALAIEPKDAIVRVTLSDEDGAARNDVAHETHANELACDALLLRLSLDDALGALRASDGALFVAVDSRQDPHPRCRPRSSCWKLSSSPSRPTLTGRPEPVERAARWCDPRCARCAMRCAIVEAADDSGTGWRQQFVSLLCARCGRWSLWHYDD